MLAGSAAAVQGESDFRSDAGDGLRDHRLAAIDHVFRAEGGEVVDAADHREPVVRESSQSGTGRFFERRNSGLKSLL